MIEVRTNKPESEEDYAAILAVYNAAWPDNRGTVQEWRHGDKQWREGFLYQRYVAEHEGRIVAEGVLMDPYWIKAPNKYEYGYTPLPEYEERVIEGRTVHDAVYDFVLQQLSSVTVDAILTSAREDRAFRVQWLADRGFTNHMRYPVSQLDVASFDFGRFDGVQERMGDLGIQITSLAELQARDPDWRQKIYDLCIELERDIPSPHPFEPEPIDEFEKVYIDPNFLAEAWFVAVDTTTGTQGVGPYVGVSMLGASQADPQKLHTWLTGVARSHRKQGIATAMKLRAIGLARQRGAKVIQTDNEENNPMFQLNLALGFKPIPAWLDFEKKLAG